MVEPSHGLLKRGETARSFPVQAIALGKDATILALSGEARQGRISQWFVNIVQKNEKVAHFRHFLPQYSSFNVGF